MMVGYQLFNALTTYDFTKSELVGLAAESWDVNDGADEFTFHLVKGAKFHDGTTVTSKSFKQGWERILNPNTSTEHASAIGYHLAMVDGYSELSAGEADELKGVTCPGRRHPRREALPALRRLPLRLHAPGALARA